MRELYKVESECTCKYQTEPREQTMQEPLDSSFTDVVGSVGQLEIKSAPVKKNNIFVD